ncbi:MAG: carbohydrate-binding protein [Abditibacteriota bacterium]|nr:carbohydrate-binding protein [Abditibacteriota bacterium]
MRYLLLCLFLSVLAASLVRAGDLELWRSLCRPEGLPVEKGPSGVPMGGIGCGYVELGPEGFLVRNCMNNIHESYIGDPRGSFFAIREKTGGRTRTVRLQKDDDVLWGMKGAEDIDYSGMFPVADSVYTCGPLATRARMTSYSFLVPYSPGDSALPVVFFDFSLTNDSANKAELSLLFSFADVIGRGIKDTERWAEEGFRMDGNSSFWHFMTPPDTKASPMSVKGWTGASLDAAAPFRPSKLTLQNYNGHIALLSDGETSWGEYMLADKGAFDAFRETGAMKPCPVEPAPEPADKPAKALAVARQVELLPGETKRVFFALAWFADPVSPETLAAAKRHSGMSYDKYYHNYFDSIGSLLAYAIDRRERLLGETLAWQLPILRSSLPGWLKFKIINSGYTVYTNGVLTRDGDYTSLEGGMGGLGGTMDQKLSSNPFVYALLPQLDRNENMQFGNYPEPGGEISHFDVHYYDGINTHVKKEDGGIGQNSDMARAAGTQGSMVDNTGTWLLQLVKTYEQTGDGSLIRRYYPRIKAAMAFMEQRHNSLGFPDYNTTYDDHPHPKGFVYTAVLYPVMLEAARRAAVLCGDGEGAAKYAAMRQKALEGAEALFVEDGGYYAYGYDFGKDEPVKSQIHTGALAGQFISRLLGWDNLPYDRAKSSLAFTLSTAIGRAPGYYSPKAYDVEDDRYLDMQSSACWPFYQDSYVAMAAIQMGMVRDGLTLLEATQKVHADKGFLWTQSLWTPAFLTYMTAPVSWYVTQTLAGASVDVPGRTLTLGPARTADNTMLPLYFPDFWAELYINYPERRAQLKITRSRRVHVFETLQIRTGDDRRETAVLPAAFRTEKGAMLDLTPWFGALTACEGDPALLKPAPEYRTYYPELEPEGRGAKKETFSEGAPAESVIVADIDGSLTGDRTVYSGYLLPKYMEEYELCVVTDGAARLEINGRDLGAGGRYLFDQRKKYAFRLTAEKASRVRLEWESFSLTREKVPASRLYPPVEVGMPVYCADATELTGPVRVEDGHLGFIENGCHALLPPIDIPAGRYTLAAEVSSATEGGTLTVKSGDRTLCAIDVKNTGGWTSFREQTAAFDTEGSSGPLLLEFAGGSGYLFNVKTIELRKEKE